MKTSISILLLALFALHHVGYYFVFKALKHQNDLAWQAKVIHNDFDVKQLQNISIAMTLPYQPDQKEYENVNESFELHGNFYRIVKKRYARDTLHIVYVSDRESKKIHNNLKKWTNQFTQNDQDSQSKDTPSVLRFIQSQYLRVDYTFQPLSIAIAPLSHGSYYMYSLNQIFPKVPVPPPKSLSV